MSCSTVLSLVQASPGGASLREAKVSGLGQPRASAVSLDSTTAVQVGGAALLCPLLSPSLPISMCSCAPDHCNYLAWSPETTSVHAGYALLVHAAQVSCVAMVPVQQCSSTPDPGSKDPRICIVPHWPLCRAAAAPQKFRPALYIGNDCNVGLLCRSTTTQLGGCHLPTHNSAKQGSPKGCTPTPDCAGWHSPARHAAVQGSPAQSRSSTPGLASPARGADSGAPPRYRPTPERSRAASPGSGASSVASSVGLPAAPNTRQPAEVCGGDTCMRSNGPHWGPRGRVP